ncbi:hypothetical protein GCM10028833_41950 [Glycomyces tarimensis]
MGVRVLRCGLDGPLPGALGTLGLVQAPGEEQPVHRFVPIAKRGPLQHRRGLSETTGFDMLSGTGLGGLHDDRRPGPVDGFANTSVRHTVSHTRLLSTRGVWIRCRKQLSGPVPDAIPAAARIECWCSRRVILRLDGPSIEADRSHLYGKVSCTVEDSGGD